MLCCVLKLMAAALTRSPVLSRACLPLLTAERDEKAETGYETVHFPRTCDFYESGRTGLLGCCEKRFSVFRLRPIIRCSSVTHVPGRLCAPPSIPWRAACRCIACSGLFCFCFVCVRAALDTFSTVGKCCVEDMVLMVLNTLPSMAKISVSECL